MANNKTCPSCSSDNVRSVPLVYEQESGVSVGRFSGVGVDGDGIGGFGGVSVTRTISALGERLSPPTPPKLPRHRVLFWVAAIPMIVGTSALLINFAMDPSPEQRRSRPIAWLVSVTGTALAAWVYVLLRRRFHEDRFVFEGEIAKWSRQWVCLQCGKTFKPQS